MDIIFLGTGANSGSPQIDLPIKNFKGRRRLRSSLLLQTQEVNIIVDCGPDFRQQIVGKKISLQDIGFITISHLHWDHSLGLMETSAGKPLKIPIHVPKKLQKELEKHQLFGFLSKAKFIKFVKKTSIGVKIRFIEVPHSPAFPTFATIVEAETKRITICSDIESIPKKLSQIIKTSNLVIFGGTFLKRKVSGHIPIEESAPILKKLNGNVIFTHINNSESESDIKKVLKIYGFKLAFDGMKIKV